MYYGNEINNTKKSFEKTSTALTALRYFGAQVKLGEMKHHVMIYKMYDRKNQQYQAFCSGNIITNKRVLTSSHCFLTNRKRNKVDLCNIRVVAGILTTIAKEAPNDTVQQWRTIIQIYSQKFYRYPAYNLAILELNEEFWFNQYVNLIPYARWNQDFDGVCTTLSVYPTKSWATSKQLFSETLKVIRRRTCEWILLRSCRLYICTAYNNILKHPEIQGSGLLCYGTNDPEEKDEQQGVLVAVTSLVNVGIPSFHSRVALFHKWVTDDCSAIVIDKFILLLSFLYCIIKLI